MLVLDEGQSILRDKTSSALETIKINHGPLFRIRKRKEKEKEKKGGGGGGRSRGKRRESEFDCTAAKAMNVKVVMYLILSCPAETFARTF